MSHPSDSHEHPHEHEHGHDHGHTPERHAHVHSPEWHEERLHHEDLVLDIGDDIGALMIVADERFAEREVEVSPVGDDARRTHTAFHARMFDGATRYVGVYAALPEGEYRVWVDEPGLANSVTVRGGEVATLAWTATTPAPRLPIAEPGSEEQVGT